MSHALTASQIDVLRRVRDDNLWSADRPLHELLREAMFLATLGLLAYEPFGIFNLTSTGDRYLAEIERSALDTQPPDSP